MTAPSDPLERMANVVAHEIRNPLAVIKNSLYFVKTKLGGEVDPKVDKHLAIIEGQVRRTNEIIAEMLAFARPLEVHVRACSARELIDLAIALKALPGKGPSMDFSDSQVLADPEAARVALRNLLDNANEAAGEAGTVFIGVQRTAKGVDFVVRDSGPGVSADARPRLFEPFFTTKPRGLGLGLATARRLAEAQGGSVDLTEAGPGAVFRLRLPSP